MYVSEYRSRKCKIYMMMFCVSFLVILGLLIGLLYPRSPEVKFKYAYLRDFNVDTAHQIISFGVEVNLNIYNPNYLSADVNYLLLHILYKSGELGIAEAHELHLSSRESNDHDIHVETHVSKNLKDYLDLSVNYALYGNIPLQFKGPVKIEIGSSSFTIDLDVTTNVTSRNK